MSQVVYFGIGMSCGYICGIVTLMIASIALRTWEKNYDPEIKRLDEKILELKKTSNDLEEVIRRSQRIRAMDN